MSKERNSGYQHVDDENHDGGCDFDLTMTMSVALMMTKTPVKRAKEEFHLGINLTSWTDKESFIVNSEYGLLRQIVSSISWGGKKMTIWSCC